MSALVSVSWLLRCELVLGREEDLGAVGAHPVIEDAVGWRRG